MPVDWSRYPDNWAEISLRIRERDGWKCKFCGVPNQAAIQRDYNRPTTGFVVPEFFHWCEKRIIARLVKGVNWWALSKFDQRIAEINYEKYTVVVLTVAHLGAPINGQPGNPHDKHDVRDCNLAALCQRCHLMYDLDDHILNAARFRRTRRIAGGQLELI